MATYPELTDSGSLGTDGAHVSSSNSIFDTIVGAANGSQPTWTNVSHGSTLALHFVTTSQDLYCRVDLAAAQDLLWQDFYIYVSSNPGANMILASAYSGSTLRVADLQLAPATSTTFQLKLRTGTGGGESATAQWTSAAINTGEWHRLAWKVQAGSSTGLRLKIYSGANLDGSTPSQDSGDKASTQGTTTNLYRYGVPNSTTVDFKIANLRADDAVQPAAPGGGGGGGGGGSTDIPELTEGFESGTASAAIGTGNSFISSHTGASNGTFNADPYLNSLAADCSTSSGDDNFRVDLTTAQPKAWQKFALKVVTMPGANATICNWYSTTTNKVCDLQIVPGGGTFQLRIRNGSDSQVLISSALATGAYHEVAVLVDPSTGHAQLRVYSGTDRGTATATYSSGSTVCAPAGGATTFNLFRWGVISSSTTHARYDAFRADTTTEPPGIAPPGNPMAVAMTCPTGSGHEPYDPFTLTITVTGGVAPFTVNSVTQLAGTTTALSGSGLSRTGTPSGVENGETLTYRASVTDSAGSPATVTADCDVVVYKHNKFIRQGGVKKAFDLRIRQGGVLV